jgi:hypothetical protein
MSTTPARAAAKRHALLESIVRQVGTAKTAGQVRGWAPRSLNVWITTTGGSEAIQQPCAWRCRTSAAFASTAISVSTSHRLSCNRQLRRCSTKSRSNSICPCHASIAPRYTLFRRSRSAHDTKQDYQLFSQPNTTVNHTPKGQRRKTQGMPRPYGRHIADAPQRPHTRFCCSCNSSR